MNEISTLRQAETQQKPKSSNPSGLEGALKNPISRRRFIKQLVGVGMTGVLAGVIPVTSSGEPSAAHAEAAVTTQEPQQTSSTTVDEKTYTTRSAEEMRLQRDTENKQPGTVQVTEINGQPVETQVHSSIPFVENNDRGFHDPYDPSYIPGTNPPAGLTVSEVTIESQGDMGNVTILDAKVPSDTQQLTQTEVNKPSVTVKVQSDAGGNPNYKDKRMPTSSFRVTSSEVLTDTTK